jgi:D-inositol-3-phosphate glycosyltransferase
MPESILLVSHYFPPHVGGIENVVREQAKHLALLGRDVTVLTTAIGESAGVHRHPNGYTVARVRAWNGVERKTKVPFPVVAPWSIRTFLKLVRAADVVHIHDLLYMTSWLAGVSSFILRKPLVLTQHVEMIDHPSRLVTGVQKLVYTTAGRAMVHVAGRILYLNSTVFDFLTSLGADEEKLAFVPNGVDTDTFYPVGADRKQRLREELGLPADAVLALFVGRFVAKKGYDIVLDMTSSRYRLVFVGDQPSAEDRRRAGSIFLGRLTSRELADVYRACDIFVLPSTSEGFPLSVQEAMASGLAVVTSDDPGYDVYELDRERVALVRRDVESVSAALEHVAADAEVRGGMARYSYELASNRFLWMTHARAVNNVYRDVLSVPAGG